MAIFDIVILAIIGLLALIGFLRGFVRELAEIVGLFAGIFLSAKFAAPLGASLLPQAWSPAVKTPVASILIVIVSWVAIVVGVFVIRKLLFHGPLKAIDKKLGAVFGAFKGLVVVLIGVVLIMISPLNKNLEDWALKSTGARFAFTKIYPIVKKYKSKVIKKITLELNKYFRLDDPDLDPAVRNEIAEMITGLSSAMTDEERQEIVETLSPQSIDHIRDLIDNPPLSGDVSLQLAQLNSPELDWISQQVSPTKLAKQLSAKHQ